MDTEKEELDVDRDMETEEEELDVVAESSSLEHVEGKLKIKRELCSCQYFTPERIWRMYDIFSKNF